MLSSQLAKHLHENSTLAALDPYNLPAPSPLKAYMSLHPPLSSIQTQPTLLPITSQDLLPLLRGELRHHQLHGVKWLVSLYMAGLNGILADELDCDRRVSG